MAYQTGDIILDTHYNGFVTSVNTMWGAGTGVRGYGQSTTVSTVSDGTTITATTAFVPDASDGAALGTSALEFSDLFLAD